MRDAKFITSYYLPLHIMFLSKASLDVMSHASGSPTRPILTGVYVTDTVSVATDSYRLLEVSHPVINPDDMPVQLQSTGEGSVIIPTVAIAKARANIPKKCALQCLHNVSVSIDDMSVHLKTSDLETIDDVSARAIEGKYPDYKQIIPSGEPKVRIAVSAKYLKDMAAYFEKHAVENYYVEIEVTDSTTPLIMRAKVGSNQDAVGVLMPLSMHPRPEPTPEPIEEEKIEEPVMTSDIKEEDLPF